MKGFTDALFNLFVRQGLGLSDSLLIMSRKPKSDKISRAAAYVYAELENGNLFSNALKSCSFIAFNEVYVSFILLAEKNGDLKSTIAYLKEKLSREQENRKRLAGASVYPIFVILLSIAACVFIGLYTKSCDFGLLLKFVLVLIFVCGASYFLISRMLGNNCLAESFKAVDFLVRNGIELSEAVACAVNISGPSTKTGRFFESARTKLSYGMDLQNAFKCRELKTNGKISEAFYYADCGGEQSELFGRMAAYLEGQSERNRTICLTLVEPFFIVIAGGFLLLLIMTFFMPLIYDTGLI